MSVRFKEDVKGERIGLFTLDPGRTTGYTVSTPVLDGTIEEIFQRDRLTVGEIRCEDPRAAPQHAEHMGAIEVVGEYQDAQAEWTLSGIPITHQFFVMEDFVLNKLGSSERSGLAPVRVTSLIHGLLMSQKAMVNYRYIMPGEASNTISSERMKRWGIWTPKLEHGRSATRVAATFVRKAMQ